MHFLLGRNPALSLAELSAFFDASSFGKIRHGFMEISDFMKSPQKFLNRLGGTIKILETFEKEIPKEKLLATLEVVLKNHFGEKTGKWTFGVNIIPDNHGLLKWLLLSLKKNLRSEGKNIRFVNKNFKNLSHVTVWNEKLTSEGLELTLFPASSGQFFELTKTVAVQDFKSYGLRDYGKPFRDPKSGMLPPKLAQIMINLAVGSAHDVCIIDPFCGTGTILMEALLMGYKTVGFDRNDAMVTGAKQNLEWLEKMFAVSHEWSVSKRDALTLTSKDFPTPYAIVTESYLGPPLSTPPPPELLEKIWTRLEALHLGFFTNMKKYIPEGTPIIIMFPHFKNKKRQERFASCRLIDKITRLGYSKTDLLPHNSALSQHSTILYDREDQIVGREIVRFIPE